MSIQHCVSMIYIYFFVLYFIGFLTILTYDGEIHLLTYLYFSYDRRTAKNMGKGKSV